MKKATLFKPNTGPSTDRHRTSRQSVRGRISAPIPMPDPLQSVPDLPGVPGPSGTGHEPSHSPMPQSPGAASFVPEATEAVPIAAPVEIQTVAPEPDTSGPTAATIPPASTALLSPSQRETGKISPASAGLSKTPPQQPSPASTPQPRPLSKRPAHAATAGPAMVPDIASAASRSTPSSERVSSVLQQRVRASSTLRYSEASVLSESPRISHGRGGSSDARPQRKKSGFRGAFSKLFSRRKQTDSSPPSGATPGYVAAPQHRSVRSVCSASLVSQPGVPSLPSPILTATRIPPFSAGPRTWSQSAQPHSPSPSTAAHSGRTRSGLETCPSSRVCARHIRPTARP